VFFSFWVLLGSSGFFWCSSGVLLVFFWCSSGVLLAFFWLLVFDNTEEHQKNARRTQKNPEEHQKNTRRETAAMSVTAVIQTETTSDFI